MRRFLGWLALLLAVRALFVAALADVFFYGEELEKGTAAKAMLDGVPLAHHLLAYHPYEGGGFVVSHLKALAFLAVGPSVLAHKLVALASCAAVFAAGYRLVAWHFGTRAAGLFALAFTFGPLAFQELSLLSLGIHFEACAFVALVVDETLRLLRAPRGSPVRPAALVRLGLASGFGLYFSYQLAPFVGLAGLALCVRRPEVVLGRGGLVGLGAFLLGAAPLVAMAALAGRAVLDVHGEVLGASPTGLERAGAFVRSLYVGVDPRALVAAVAYPAGLVVASVLGARTRAARAPLAWIGGLLVIWCAVYLASGFAVGAVAHPFQLMRLAPGWFLGTVLAAGGLAAGFDLPGPPARLARAVTAALLALGLGNSAALLSAASPGTPLANLERLASTKGYDYEGYFAKLVPRLVEAADGERPRALAPLLAFDEPALELLRSALASVAYRDVDLPIEGVRAELAALDPEGMADFERGLGPWLARHSGGDAGRVEAVLAREEGPARARLLEGLGRVGPGFAVAPAAIERELATSPWAREPAYLRGMGERAFRWQVVRAYGGPQRVLRPGVVLHWIETLPPAVAPALRTGFEGAERAWRLR